MINKKNTTLKSYKGFNKDLKCRDFQYEVGKEYETDRAIICTEGFHACTDPLAVWDYYSPCDNHRFCEVGTAKEQYDRCAEYCKAHNHDCKNCPLGAKKYQYGATCELYWAQMPYGYVETNKGE